MDTQPSHRSEACADGLPGYAACATEEATEEATAAGEAVEAAVAAAPLRVLPWLTLAVALVGGSALTLVAAPP